MTLDEKWKADLDIRLNQEKQALELRIAALELAVGVVSLELQRVSPEARGRMGMTIAGRIKTSDGLFGSQIETEARKLLNV